MISKMRPCLLSLLIAPAALAAAEPRPVESRVESVGLFKNGLFVVRETIPVSGPGTYHLDAIPKAIHGTLWFESDAVFEARAVTREETRPAATPRNIAEAARLYANRSVSLELIDNKLLVGEVVPPVAYPVPPPPAVPSPFSSSSFNPGSPSGSPENVIILRTGGTLNYILTSSVRALRTQFELDELEEDMETVGVPSLELVVQDMDGADGMITMTYLTDGMAWAPSYRLDYDADGTAHVTMSTVVRNEWRDITETRVDLISGFPQIEYSSVTSPLWRETSLSSFFSQLSNMSSPRGGGAIMSQMVMSNMAMPVATSSFDLSSAMAGGGEDLHYLDMGTLTLPRGSAVSRRLASAETSAERFVDWRIADERNIHGHQETRLAEHDAWDSIRFANPFDFAMTTAPTAVWMDGKFRGQSTTTFTNPGAEAIARTTKALSVETIHEEFDIGRGDPRRIMHYDYQPVTVRAEMKVTNRRNTPVKIEITREFQGTKLSASDEPAKLRTYSKRDAVNPQNEARWNLEIPAGEERLVTLDYEVLVRI
jgi:hypothetical protein